MGMQTDELLKEARRQAGLTQAQVARRAGTSQPAVARYENGVSSPSVSTLERLLHACGRELVLMTTPARSTDLSGPLGRRLRRLRAQVLRVARRHGARNVRVFGSVARGEEDAESDIDLIVDLDPDRTLLDLVALTRDLTELLGVKVDVATLDLLKDRVLARASREIVPL